jgi:uncharacterized protein
MLWRGRKGSSNVEDRRGISGGGIAAGGGILGVLFLLANYFLGGGDASQLPQILEGGGQQQQEMTAEQKARDDERKEFVSVVLQDTEDVWSRIYSQQGEDYPEPKLVLFRGSTQSGCGGGSAAMGPFYCPADQKIYIDLSFMDDLANRFDAPGEFAMAYVVAHEVGHHIQTVNGTSAKLQRARQQMSQTEYNKMSVKLELQADFLAGVWAHHAQKMKNILNEQDIKAALDAANAIGDDKLQQESQGRITPDAFTHGSSAQRVYWFKRGFETGDIRQGNTFEEL